MIGLGGLIAIAHHYDAIVLDQWGVLHDGSAPYPGAVAALADLRAAGVTLAVLSNSGKRAGLNAARITQMGFAPDLFAVVMTSGEALWQDIALGAVAPTAFFAIAAAPGDAARWAAGLGITLVDRVADAGAVLLMGLPDDGAHDAGAQLDAAHARGLPVYCTNPDRASPRAGGVTVPSPGALAHDYARAGGSVHFYGKPHEAVFDATARALGARPERLLMVGDSLEHDIAGGQAAGWQTAFVTTGLHAADLADAPDRAAAVAGLCRKMGVACPDFTLKGLGA